MVEQEGFDAMAQACIDNHEAVMLHGSPEMRSASRMLLFTLAEEIQRRERGAAAETNDES